MSNRFWGLLALAAGLVGAIIWGALYFNQNDQVNLTGYVRKVRMQSTGPDTTMVVADFRITNPSTVPFVVNSVTLSLDPPGKGSDPVESRILSKVDVAQVFEYLTHIGPQYNDVLTIRDQIKPGQSVDRMAGAAFDVPTSVIESRGTLRVRIQEVDGVVAEITEKK